MSMLNQVHYSNLIIENENLKIQNEELRKKLKKIRKEKKRWKNKYLEFYNYVKKMEDTTYLTIKEPINEDGLKPTNSTKSRVQPGSMDWLYEV